MAKGRTVPGRTKQILRQNAAEHALAALGMAGRAVGQAKGVAFNLINGRPVSREDGLRLGQALVRIESNTNSAGDYLRYIRAQGTSLEVPYPGEVEHD